MLKPIEKIALLFDRICKGSIINAVERHVVSIALVLFLLHLGALFVAKHIAFFTPLISILGPGYLAAIATPFTVILLFEIFLLIMTIPQSITRSIGRQYEIISLIVIRDVFHELGKIEYIPDIIYKTEIFQTILIDLLGGIILFLLVTVFYHIKNKCIATKSSLSMKKFITLKKAGAIALSIALVGLLIEHTALYFNHALTTTTSLHDTQTEFFVQFFTLMVFVDVFILIFSYRYTADYEVFWRNSGFIISTILIRFSLTLEKPFDIIMAVVSLLFGIGTLLIYMYFRKIHTWKEIDRM